MKETVTEGNVFDKDHGKPGIFLTSPIQEMGAHIPLEGSSRTTGGTLRGKAIGNVFNLSDSHELTLQAISGRGIVKVHEVLVENPDGCAPKMVLKMGVFSTLGPILTKLGQ